VRNKKQGGGKMKKKAVLVCMKIFLVGTLTVATYAEESAKSVTFDIIFGKGSDVDLKLDLARPTGGDGPFPALIFIHGGGYGYYSGNDKGQYFNAIKQAAKRGYVAVSVEHRLISVKEKGKTKFPFPAQVHDMKCAVRWLRANAVEYAIDPNRIGAVGWSSGGDLALMLGLTDPSDGLEGECGNLEYSSRVQAVVSLAGSSDFTLFGDNDILRDLLGGTLGEVPDKYKAASPLSYVSGDDPPVLLVHGDMDTLVPLKQAQLLDEKMTEMGLPHTLIIKKNTGHENSWYDNAVWDFIDSHLKNK
jgi:acetyl esterase/lipase